MRIDVSARIGNRDSAVYQLSSSTLTAPASDRLCDTAVVAFALWTVSAYAVVLTGRGLVALLLRLRGETLEGLLADADVVANASGPLTGPGPTANNCRGLDG